MILGVMNTVQLSLPWHPLLAGVFIFLAAFVILRVIVRVWDLVGF